MFITLIQEYDFCIGAVTKVMDVDNNVSASTQYDVFGRQHLGRIRLARQLDDVATESEGDETSGIKVQTRYGYSATNSYQAVSNPYRAAYSSQAGAEPSMGWTLSKSDQAGRIIAIQTYSGYTLPTPWRKIYQPRSKESKYNSFTVASPISSFKELVLQALVYLLREVVCGNISSRGK